MNKNIKMVAFGILASGIVFATAAIPAFAQSYTTATGPRETIVANRCSIVTARVNNLVTRIQFHQGRWNDVKTRLQTANQRIMTYLQNHNPEALSQYQTLESAFVGSLTPLQTDGQNLYNAILKIQTDANAGMCGTSNGAFKADLEAAKPLLQQFRTDEQTSRSDFQAIRTYVQSLRPVATPTLAQ